MGRKFGIVMILLWSIFFTYADEDPFEAIETTDYNQFIPASESLIQQQTETIRKIVQAKSMEVERNFNISDSILLTRCQQLAQKQNSNNKAEEDYKKEQEAESSNRETKIEDHFKEEAVKKEEHKKEEEETRTEINNDAIIDRETVEESDQIKPPEITERIEPQVISYPYGNTFYYIYHRFFPETVSNGEQKMETTSTTTSEPVYTEKMRFVLRMPYPKQETLSNYPWDFDRYAYYPKHMQPEYVNMPVPYTPRYHMIRRLIVPSNVAANYIVEANP